MRPGTVRKLITTMLVLLAVEPCLATTVYINFMADSGEGGDPADSTSKTWNNADPNPVFDSDDIADLLDEDGNSTGWGYDQAGVPYPTGFGQTGVNSVGSGDAAWIDEAEITHEYHYVDNTRTADFDITGLDDGETYSFEWFCSRDTTGSRIVEVSTDGFSTTAGELECIANTSNVMSIDSVSPSSGIITFQWRVKSGSSFGYINALKITEDAAAGSIAPQAYYIQDQN